MRSGWTRYLFRLRLVLLRIRQLCFATIFYEKDSFLDLQSCRPAPVEATRPHEMIITYIVREARKKAAPCHPIGVICGQVTPKQRHPYFLRFVEKTDMADWPRRTSKDGYLIRFFRLRSISRSESRLAMVSLLSKAFLPLASPSSTLALPFFK